MTDRFVAVDADAGIAELRTALEALQEDRNRLTYLYVLNAEGLPEGQISMVDLALAPAEAASIAIAAPLTAVVSVDTPAQECARLRRHYNLTQLPVVEGNMLIGVVLLTRCSESLSKRTRGRCFRSPTFQANAPMVPWPPRSARGCPG